MLYVYYNSSGIVESIIQCNDTNTLRPEENLQSGQNFAVVNQTIPNDYSTYAYKFISGSLVRGDKRPELI